MTHLEKLCRILLCEPHDLPCLYPRFIRPCANDHLAFLERKESVNMHAIINTLTHRQMVELAAEIAEALPQGELASALRAAFSAYLQVYGDSGSHQHMQQILF
ncbi:MAG: hypothetical protein IPJ85_13630 [Flavobacteriales bacterium]|nr:hypothetical protein [Flavobacteriales bacterium]